MKKSKQFNIEAAYIVQMVGFNCDEKAYELIEYVGEDYDIFTNQQYRNMYRDIKEYSLMNKIDYQAMMNLLISKGYFANIKEYTDFILNDNYSDLSYVSSQNLFILLKDNQVRRNLIIMHQKEIDSLSNNGDVFTSVDKTRDTLDTLTHKTTKSTLKSSMSLVEITNGWLEERRANPKPFDGLLTGYKSLDKILCGIAPTELVYLAARPSIGKCFRLGTRFIMYDGSLKNVEDIVVGDQLMGDDSKPRNVLSLARGREDMYWVRQQQGIDYCVNKSHILSLKRSRTEGKHTHGDILNIEVNELLNKSDKFKSNYKGYKVPVKFAQQETGLDPYFLGLWLGDGSSANGTISNPDKEIWDYLKAYAMIEGYEFKIKQYGDKCPSLSLKRKENRTSIAERLRAMNLLENKHIPQNYLINSKKNRLRLLAGLIDTDGYLNSNGVNYEITQKNERLIKEIKYLADTLGFRTTLSPKVGTIKELDFEGLYWKLNISGNINEIPVLVNRKKARAWDSIRNPYMTGIKLEYAGVDDYYGFEIDGNRLFLLEDGTVVHNTAIALNIALNMASAGKRVAFFSLEMSVKQIMLRILSVLSGIDINQIKYGNHSPDTINKLDKALADFYNMPFYIDDTSGASLQHMKNRILMMPKEERPEIVFVDYLQLMTPPAAQIREQEVAKLSSGLKHMCKEFNNNFIVLAQLNRALEARVDKRPMLSDLRESGSLEQDADKVLFLHRPEFYGIDTLDDGRSSKDVAEVIVAKNREGDIGSAKLIFQKSKTKFVDSKI